MEALQIDISATRALTVTGRLVAGETAQITIGGATPTALYLVAPGQTVVAACEAFTPTGEGSGGVGFLQLATEQVAALFANTPAGRMVAVWALVNNADGVAGAGWIPVVSAPMPDELIDLNIDFYLRASQVGAGLAIVDGKLVCNVNPDNYLTKAEAAATYATQAALSDIAGQAQDAYNTADAALNGLSNLAPVASTGSYNDLTDKPTIPTVPVQSVNGQTGAVVLNGTHILVDGTDDVTVAYLLNLLYTTKAAAADLRYALPGTVTEITSASSEVVSGETIYYGEATLADRTQNQVAILVALDELRVTIPPAVSGKVRDFGLLVGVGLGEGTALVAPALVPVAPTGEEITIMNAEGKMPTLADGTTTATGVTVLYFTEVGIGTFFVKGEQIEVA